MADLESFAKGAIYDYIPARAVKALVVNEVTLCLGSPGSKSVTL